MGLFEAVRGSPPRRRTAARIVRVTSSTVTSWRPEVLRQLALHRESRVEEGHLLADHVHMLVSIPPKYSVAQVIGYLKGKSAIHIAREFADRPRNFVGQHFWARGYFVSTVGRDEQVIREYIQQQEREDRRLDRLPLD